MYSLLRPVSSAHMRAVWPPRHALRLLSTSRRLQNNLITPKVDYGAKYAEKLRKRAEEQGKSVAELRQQLKEAEAAKRKEQSATATQPNVTPSPQKSQATNAGTSTGSPKSSNPSRKDSSPVKPLSSILNLSKLLESTHSAEQISLLWQAYHTSRSNGTGRGYLCATIPVEAYEKMVSVAAKYPCFVIPVPRDDAQVSEQPASKDQRAHEFFYMEWGFHGVPTELHSADADPFIIPKLSPNPQTSTILFAPLQEYKLRTSFATPYLVLTNYTDLARSHGIVLLRGEITPSASNSGDAGGDGRYMLNQQDAQLLALGTQKFYLWNEGMKEREELLRKFHENPAEFNWEELLKHTEFLA